MVKRVVVSKSTSQVVKYKHPPHAAPCTNTRRVLHHDAPLDLSNCWM